MKILYYCPEYYYRHGGRTHARGFFSALQKLPGVSGAFLYPQRTAEDPGQDSSAEQNRRDKLWFLPETIRRLVRFFRPRPGLTDALIEEIQRHGCDALVMRTGTQQPALDKIKAACPNTVLCLEVNSAYLDESLQGLPLRKLFQHWEVRRYRQADVVFVVSSYLKQYLQERGVPADKIVVNQNGVNTEVTDLSDVADLREKYAIPPDAFVIGYIGGMETFRRLPEVVQAIAQLRRAGNNDIYLLMVGDGEDMDAVRAVTETHRDRLQDAVILTGWVPHAEVSGYLATFDLAIFPFTNAYCSPLKLFEYLGAGLATLGPDTPAVREVFQDDVHLGLIKQDGSDFIARVLELRNDPQRRARLSRQGQQLVLNEYTWEKNAERVAQKIRCAGHG